MLSTEHNASVVVNADQWPVGSVVVPSGQQVVVVSPKPTTIPADYKYRQTLYLGLTMIITGSLCIVFNIVDLIVSEDLRSYWYAGDSLGFVGHGIWAGSSLVVAGSFAVAVVKRKTVPMIRAYLAFSIIAMILGAVAVGVAISGAVLLGEDNIFCCFHDSYYCYGGNLKSSAVCDEYRTLFAMDILIGIMAATGGICAIWSTVLGCRGLACCQDKTQQFVVARYDVPRQTEALQQQQQQPQPMTSVPVYSPPNDREHFGAPPDYQYVTDNSPSTSTDKY
jgi:hypothetical protein